MHSNDEHVAVYIFYKNLEQCYGILYHHMDFANTRKGFITGPIWYMYLINEKKRWKFDLCPVKSNIFMYMNIYSILKSVQLYIKSKNQFKMKILNFVLPEGYFLVLCNDSQRDL